MIPLIAAGWIALGLLRSSKTQQAAAAAAKPGAPGSGSPGGPGTPGEVLTGQDFLPGPGVPRVPGVPVDGTRTENAPPPPAYIETRPAPGGGGFVSVFENRPPWHIPTVDLCGKAFIPERCSPIWGGGQTWYERYDLDDCGTCKAFGKGNRARRRKP